ncbi:rho GTPase-activating protein 39-like [Anneissia japonica]|uniref:rho GTPase-activating protein 39-like n=1 Tax=Anneissia japonica TaxID=1529436 RepID=UPI00142591DB|nr:rho GTPase-activating protein 39-like [Anneissia japonica]
MYYQQKHGTIPSNMQTSASLVIAKKPTASETELEKYAVENLNKHKKGIFRKPVSLAHMLSWTKEPIKKPMLMTRDKEVKREGLESFKYILWKKCYYIITHL